MKIDNACSRPRYNGKGFSLYEQEFAADVVLVARRAVANADPQFSNLFSVGLEKHILQRMNWKACVSLVIRTIEPKYNRGEFFHDVYRTQALLGKSFVECTPYAIFPISEYFSCQSQQLQKIDVTSKKSMGSKYPYMLGRIDRTVARDWVLDLKPESDEECVRTMTMAAA